MQKRWMGVLMVWLCVLAGARPAVAQATGRYILRTPSANFTTVLSRHELTVAELLRDDGIEAIAVVTAPVGADPVELEGQLDDDLEVAGFEADRHILVGNRNPRPNLTQSTAAILEALGGTTAVTYYGTSVPSSYVSQIAGSIMRVPSAQVYGTGAGATVAVIDTGVDAKHPALRGVVLPGYDFTRNTAGVASDLADLSQSTAAILEQSTAAILEQRNVFLLNQSTAAILEQSTAAILEGLPPSFGHGTAVAGLIHYVAPNARILPLKAFHADGSAELSDIVRAIYYAADSGARVINMSFTTTESSQELMRAIDYATSRKAICVAAAGNEGREMVVFPAGYRPVVAVGSTTNLDMQTPFTNSGIASVSIAAPGETLVTAYPGGHWAAVSGTSFSSGFVSGGIALMVGAYPAMSSSQVREDISKGAVQVSGLGDGRVDLASAMQRAFRRTK